MALGVSIWALNILVAARIWRNVYDSNVTWFNSINLPATIFLALVAISLFIGLLLIVYSILLRNFERPRRTSEILHGSKVDDEASQVPSYAKWLVIPVLAAFAAGVVTVFAAQIIEPIAPRPCIELYQAAQNIKKDNPGFRMPWNDRDQFRCAINQTVLTN